MEEVERHAAWIGHATQAIERCGEDAEAIEQAIARWTRIGHEELGPDINLLSLLSAVRLSSVPTGMAADARLRRRQSLSETAFGAALRARAWQEDVLYLCSGADGFMVMRLHHRTLTIMENPKWTGTALDAACWVVSAMIAADGLVRDTDRPVPSMLDVQRKAYTALARDIDAFSSFSDFGLPAPAPAPAPALA